MKRTEPAPPDFGHKKSRLEGQLIFFSIRNLWVGTEIFGAGGGT